MKKGYSIYKKRDNIHTINKIHIKNVLIILKHRKWFISKKSIKLII